MPTAVDLHRAAFASAHGGRHIVSLGQGRSLLPGVVITPVRVEQDGRTVVYVARMLDDTCPAHLRAFDLTVRSIPASASFVEISSDDLGGYARWAVTFDEPVWAVFV
jgi:hypothetical protein